LFFRNIEEEGVKKKYWRPLLYAVLFLAVLSCKQPDGEAAEVDAYNPDVFGWRTASWVPFTMADPVRGFAYGGGVYVAAGSHGVIAYSHDGDAWQRARKTPDRSPEEVVTEPFKLAGGGYADFNAVVYGGGVFIVAADGGHIAYSYDGVYWTGVHEITGFGSENINGIAYGEAANGTGCFVAAGNGANGRGNISAALPGNPELWSGGGVAEFSSLKDIVFGNGRFYVAGDDGWMGWAASPAGFTNSFKANNWNWHPRKWTFSAQAGTFTPYVKKIAFGEYGQGISGLGVVFNEWGGKRIAVCAAGRFEAGDSNAWDSDIDAGFFDKEINGIVWSPWNGGVWLAAGSSAMIGYWPSSAPGEGSERYWRALSFYEFRRWEITALAVLNGRYFTGNIGGKIGYSK
jgi:hypothetical protein